MIQYRMCTVCECSQYDTVPYVHSVSVVSMIQYRMRTLCECSQYDTVQCVHTV